MKLKLAAIIMATVAIVSCSTTPEHSIVIDVKGWENCEDLMITVNNRIDTLKVDGNMYYIDLPEDIREMSAIRIYRKGELVNNRMRQHSKSIDITMVNYENIVIKGEVDDEGILRYTLTQFGDDFKDFRNSIMPTLQTLDSVTTAMQATKNTDPKYKALSRQISANVEKENLAKIEYIKNNPDTELAAYFTMIFYRDRFTECYNVLGEKAKQGRYKPTLDTKVKALEDYQKLIDLQASGIISAGNVAPGFTLPSLDGSKVSLSDYKGRWVMLDFWGSWCSWCIKGFPEMKEFYAENKDKIEILGIACSDKDKAWREAVAKSEIPWVQLFDDQNIYLNYAIDLFPTKIIIDPEGNLALVVNGEKEGFYEQALEIMANYSAKK